MVDQPGDISASGSTATAVDRNHDAPAADHKQMTKTIIAASSGNLVEWFDFYTHAFLVSTSPRNFLPAPGRLAH